MQAWNQTEHARPSGSAWWRKPSPSSPIGCSAEPSQARAIGSCHRASQTEYAQPPSRAEQTLRSVRLLGVTHKYIPTHIPACFMCATRMLSQSEASNTWAGRNSMAGHSRVTLQRHSLAKQKPGMHGGAFRSVNTAERKQPCCSVQLGRTEPSLSNRVTPPSKPN